jgi:acetylornithine deacetylase/succinyl-diaminopimelate desuccinylase-like protein
VLAAALAVAAFASAAPSAPDERYLADARRRLKSLIALDTSNPPGNEALAAKYLKAELAKDSIASEVFTSSGSRASLVARLKGDGSRRPLVLMCHTDVVPADPKEWDTPPFSPVEKDGYVYGRGAADIKSMCAVEVSILAWLRREAVPLSRDVIFFAEADEEAGNRDRHIDWLMAHHPDVFAGAEFAINEGGNTVWSWGKASEIRVQASEKEYLDLTVSARGRAGHASVPRADNAVAALARAITRIVERRPPAKVDSVVRRFFERQRETADAQLAGALTDVLASAPGADLDRAGDRLASLNPEFGAMLRDTVTPTILRGGYKANVIPAEAQATFNARLLPGRTPAELVSQLEAVVDDPNVDIKYEASPLGPIPVMPVDTALYKAAEESARQLAPDAKVMPFMAAWSTDSQYLRARGIVTYGIDPPLTEEDGERVHGKNERLDLAALDWYARFLRDVVVRVAGKPEADKPAGR